MFLIWPLAMRPKQTVRNMIMNDQPFFPELKVFEAHEEKNCSSDQVQNILVLSISFSISLVESLGSKTRRKDKFDTFSTRTDIYLLTACNSNVGSSVEMSAVHRADTFQVRLERQTCAADSAAPPCTPTMSRRATIYEIIFVAAAAAEAGA